MQKICIVIPCFNEEKRLLKNDFINFILQNANVFFCFVNDGSYDNTSEVLNSIVDKTSVNRVNILNLNTNCGKAEAVRLGMLHALKWSNFDVIGYFDADLSAPLSEIFNINSSFDSSPQILFAFGSRIKKIGSLIVRTSKRHYLGRVFSTFASLMLNLDVYDTQCGAKLFKTDIIPLIFDKPFISKWLFDIEIFFRIKNKYGPVDSLNIMLEIPLKQWINVQGSKISFTYLFKVPFELLRSILHTENPKTINLQPTTINNQRSTNYNIIVHASLSS